MGWFHVAVGVVACLLLYGTGKSIAFWVAIVATVGTLWSFGIMHNFATESAKRRPSYNGEFFDLTVRDANAVPNWLAVVNFLFSITSIGLLLYGLYVRLWS